jgi:hypothetical protein
VRHRQGEKTSVVIYSQTEYTGEKLRLMLYRQAVAVFNLNMRSSVKWFARSKQLFEAFPAPDSVENGAFSAVLNPGYNVINAGLEIHGDAPVVHVVHVVDRAGEPAACCDDVSLFRAGFADFMQESGFEPAEWSFPLLRKDAMYGHAFTPFDLHVHICKIRPGEFRQSPAHTALAGCHESYEKDTCHNALTFS